MMFFLVERRESAFHWLGSVFLTTLISPQENTAKKEIAVQRLLSQNLMEYISMDIGESKITTCMTISQFFMVKPQLM